MNDQQLDVLSDRRAPRPASATYVRAIYDTVNAFTHQPVTQSQIRKLLPAAEDFKAKFKHKDLAKVRLRSLLGYAVKDGYLQMRVNSKGVELFEIASEKYYLEKRSIHQSRAEAREKEAKRRIERSQKSETTNSAPISPLPFTPKKSVDLIEEKRVDLIDTDTLKLSETSDGKLHFSISASAFFVCATIVGVVIAVLAGIVAARL